MKQKIAILGAGGMLGSMVLDVFAKDKDFYVRYNIAKNPNTPIKILKELSKDENWGVRCHVATNINAPKSLKATCRKQLLNDISSINQH